MIGLNNLSKVEGIKLVTEDNSKVRFIAVEDDKTTLMCDSLNNQEFILYNVAFCFRIVQFSRCKFGKSFFTAAAAATEVFFAYFLVHKKVWWA